MSFNQITHHMYNVGFHLRGMLELLSSMHWSARVYILYLWYFFGSKATPRMNLRPLQPRGPCMVLTVVSQYGHLESIMCELTGCYIVYWALVLVLLYVLLVYMYTSKLFARYLYSLYWYGNIIIVTFPKWFPEFIYM